MPKIKLKELREKIKAIVESVFNYDRLDSDQVEVVVKEIMNLIIYAGNKTNRR